MQVDRALHAASADCSMQRISPPLPSLPLLSELPHVGCRFGICTSRDLQTLACGAEAGWAVGASPALLNTGPCIAKLQESRCGGRPNKEQVQLNDQAPTVISLIET